jgi:dephospho-CoA kinase
MIIGLTGKYCSGKNSVAEILEARGFHVIDVDRIGHLALREKSEAVGRVFGSTVLETDGSVNRRALGKIVFRSRRQRVRLEKILHPWMSQTVREVVHEKGKTSIVINAAVLFRMGLHTLCDTVLIIRAPIYVRLKRARKRDSLPLIEILKRLLFQGKVNFKLPNVDIEIIENEKSKSDLKSRVDVFVDSLNVK